MPNNVKKGDRWLVEWIRDIRKNCDSMDSRVAELSKPSQADEQLQYVLDRLKILENRLFSMRQRPGKNKSYAHEVNRTLDEFDSIKRDIKYWQTDGLIPEFVEMQRNQSKQKKGP